MLASSNEKDVDEAKKNIFKSRDSIKSKYIFSRDLFKTIFFSMRFSNYFNKGDIYLSSKEKDKQMVDCFYVFEEAAERGIYEAFYFLGLMHLNGFYTKVNKQLAYYYFSTAASNSHSLSYYELYKMIKNNDVLIYNENENNIKQTVVFDYLKSSAEEGYTEAMYELGNEYIKGEFCSKNYELAYAWHRQACRNGYLLSYVLILLI